MNESTSAIEQGKALSPADLTALAEKLGVMLGLDGKTANNGQKKGGAKGKARERNRTLWLHPSGQWACKRKGRYYYFGTDEAAAMAEYRQHKAAVDAGLDIGRAIRTGACTLAELREQFRTTKELAVRTGELSPRSLADYLATMNEMVRHFGERFRVEDLTPAQLVELKSEWNGRGWGVHRLGGMISRARIILRFAYENELIDKPLRFGEFKRPKKAAYRREREAGGERLFQPAEVRALLKAANPAMKAMILLGLNCGFGPADCGRLPLAAVDLAGGWITFPRGKTGIARRCPLWPETVAAIRDAVACRPKPTDPDHDGRVFITRWGGPYHIETGGSQSPISAEFRKLSKKLGIRRSGLTFYALRHALQTIGEETGDNVAIRRIMGHADPSMSDIYRERFPDQRLQRVADHVRAWLFPDAGDQGEALEAATEEETAATA